MAEYNIFELGFDGGLNRGAEASAQAPAFPDLTKPTTTTGFTGGITNQIEFQVGSESILAGGLSKVLFSGKTEFSSTVAGYRMGVDTDGIYKWIIGDATSSADWAVTTPATFTIKGTIVATSGTIGGFSIGADYIRDAANSFGLASTVTGGDDVRFWAGAAFASRASAPFRVTEAGVLFASSGTVGGWTLATTTLSATGIILDAGNQKITVGASSPSITIDGVNTRIRSSDYSTGVSGFTVEPGIIEATNILARGMLKGTTFQYDVVSAVGGQLIVSNADILGANMSALDISPLVTKGSSTFATNDLILIRAITGAGIQEEYLRITGTTLTLDAYSETNQNQSLSMYAASYHGVGQSFNSASGGTLTSCKFYLKKLGSPTGNAVAKIYALTGTSGTDAYPTGAALATSDNFDVSTLTTSFALTSLSFSGANQIVLSAGVDYGISIEYTGGTVSNNVIAGYDNSASTHSGNLFYFLGSWTFGLSNDCCFYVYATLSNGYAVTRDLASSFSADSNPTWGKGSTIVKIGSSDGVSTYSGGWLRLLGEGTNSPHYSIFSRTGVAYNSYTEVLRTGNLNGFLDYVTSIFGFAVGSSSGTNANITIDPTNGIRIRNGTTNVITLDNSGNVSVNKITATSGTIGGFTIGATDLSVTNAGNTTTISSGSTAFSAGPTGSPLVTITQAGVLTASGAVINGSPISGNDIFGSGEDGDVTISSNTSLTKDQFYNNLTINSGFRLITNGFRVFVKNTLTLQSSSFISWNGAAGTAGTSAINNSAVGGGAGGGALSSASLYGAGAGKAGGSSGAGGSAGGAGDPGTAGTAGDAITNSFASSFSSSSGAGGAGGGTSPAAGGGSGASGSISASSTRPFNSIFAVRMFDDVAGSSPALLKYNSNVGGGGGGGGGRASAGSGVGGAGGGAGGSGSGGGIIVVAARTIVNFGSIESLGGAGGNGGNGANGAATVGGVNNAGGGGGGGGTGGPGGVLVLIYSTLSGSGTTSIVGGAGGTGGTKGTQGTGGTAALDAVDGSAGSTGVSGKIITLIV